jgi:hypothetical protein
MMSRRLVPVVSLSIAVILALAPGVAAQAPPLGEPMAYVDSQGVERGSVTIADIADPFIDHDPGSPPAEGTRYVLLTVVFEAAIDQPYDVQPYQIRLRDTNDSLWGQSWVPRPPDQVVIPDFQGQTMAPGNRISGVIGFVVPDGAQVKEVLYQPESGRLITIASLAGGGPAPGEPVTVIGSEGAAADISVEVVDPYTGHDPAYPPADGQRFVHLDAVIESVGELVYGFDPYQVSLRTEDGFVYQRTPVYRTEEGASPDLEGQRLAPDDRISGVMGFSVPADKAISSVEYQPDYERMVTLADLSSSGAEAPDVTAAPEASPSPEAEAPAA